MGKLHAMPSRGDTLLFAVSAKRELSWSLFTNVLDTIFVPDERLGSDVKDIRSGVAALGDSLAHWDIAPQGNTARICIAPPFLATLPWPGLPTVALCGSRSPDTLAALSAVCDRLGASIRATPMTHVHKYAPTLIEVTANSHEALGAVAAALNIRHETQPAAWRLANMSGSITEYLASLHWSTGPELNWVRKDFDSRSLRWMPMHDDALPSGLRLSAYEHPEGWAREDRLWIGNEFAPVDRNWGRYAVLAEHRIPICRYDYREGSFAVPRQVPLPKIVARSLGLCSGRPPAIARSEGIWYHAYGQVPRTIADVLAAKLGQDLASVPSLSKKVRT
jgi:hypothetical protein